MEIVYDGSGNRNLTVGDSIFHCHFYPHFASGMWALWRVHDVLETGHRARRRRPAEGGRARAARRRDRRRHADPGRRAAARPMPMAPMPAQVEIVDGQVQFAKAPTTSPGYPFFVPGVGGHRPPHPPLEFAVRTPATRSTAACRAIWSLGGQVAFEVHSQTDFTKDWTAIDAVQLPEDGTAVEQAGDDVPRAARATRAARPRASAAVVQGPTARRRDPGAPFADPVPARTVGPVPVRRYKGADIQLDAVFNKAGWHYPQQRLMALWDDVKPMLDGTKPPEPLFFRANSGECVEYWQTNLVPILLRAGRLPGAHADRHHRPAHPSGEVRRAGVRRRRQRLQLRGRHLQPPRRCATGSPRSTRTAACASSRRRSAPCRPARWAASASC